MGESTLTDYIKQLLASHISRPLRDPPFAFDAIIYLPTAYGGLGVRSPYTVMSIARAIVDKPEEPIQEYLDIEKKYYELAKEEFLAREPGARERSLNYIFGEKREGLADAFGSDNPDTFFSFSEMIKHRESMAYPVLLNTPFSYFSRFGPVPAVIALYDFLLEDSVDSVDMTDRISENISTLAGTGDMKRWYKLDLEDRWVLRMYADECFERYGTLEIWVGEAVPQQLLKLFRGNNEDDDDAISSTVSSV